MLRGVNNLPYATPALIIIILLTISCSLLVTMSSNSYFLILNYFYKSSAGTDHIYPGSKDVQLIVEILYNGSESITGVYGRIILPEGFSISRGGQASSPAYSPNGTVYEVVSPGDLIIFRYIIDVAEDIAPGAYDAEIEIRYRYTRTFIRETRRVYGIRIVVSSYPPIKLNVIDSYWSPEAYPGSEGVTLNVVLENLGNSDIVEGYIVLELPEILHPRRVELSIGALRKKSRITISVNDIDISPDADYDKSYSSTMHISATARTDDGVTYVEEATLNFVLKLSHPPALRLELVDYGLEVPYIADGIKIGNVYVVLQSKDTARISAITAIFKISNGGRFVKGGTSSIVAISGNFLYGDYINLRSDQVIFNPGSDKLDIKLILNVFGSKDGAEFWTKISYNLIIISPKGISAGKGLSLITASWQNDYPVYPFTENATFVVTFANKWPYRVAGLTLKLRLPEGFYSNNPNNREIALAYIPGPINSLATITASFTVSVANVTPGIHEGKLFVDYIIDYDNSRIRKVEEYTVNLRVHSLKNSLELVMATWYGGSPEPKTYGALLLVVIRNNYIPNMRGITLEIFLPRGFMCSINNMSYAKIIPYIVGQASIQQALVTLPTKKPSILTRLLGGQIPTEQILNEGDFAMFMIPLNIEINETGEYFARGFLNFIDHWGNVRRVKLMIPIRILGSTKIIEVRLPYSISFVEGEAKLNLTLINRGSASIYDVFVTILPQSPLALPVQNFRYIGDIGAYRNVTVSFTLRYNPTSMISPGGMTTIRYSSLPLIISVIYKDALGYQRILNITASVLIEPFVDIRLGADTRATLRNNIIMISGTLINYGIAQARSIEIKAFINETSSSTFIGDLDPASQIAFRIEIPVSTSVNKVRLEIIYRDNYGRIRSKLYVINVEEISTTKIMQQVQRSTPFITLGHVIMIAIVIVFLASVAFMIYKISKRYSEKLMEGA